MGDGGAVQKSTMQMNAADCKPNKKQKDDFGIKKISQQRTSNLTNTYKRKDSKDYSLWDLLLLSRFSSIHDVNNDNKCYKASPWDLSSWISLSLTLDGRDKITKVIQYSSRLLGWYYTSQRWRKLQKSLTEARKAYRFGRTVTEIHKLQQMKLVKWLNHYIHWKFQIRMQEELKQQQKQQSKDNYSINEKKYQKETPISSPPEPLWKILGTLIKVLGLAGFWGADNMAYLYTTGFFTENSNKDPLHTTKHMETRVMPSKRSLSIFAARSYFFGSFAGLCVNLTTFLQNLFSKESDLQKSFQRIQKLLTSTENNKLYPSGLQAQTCQKLKVQISNHNHDHHIGKIMTEQRHESSAIMIENLKHEDEDKNKSKSFILQDNNADLTKARKLFEKAKRKHFTICISLLKSICDVIVFSNNPGIDLHLKYRGKKMNEGIHCLLGVLSASTVLYNNFPNAKSDK